MKNYRLSTDGKNIVDNVNSWIDNDYKYKTARTQAVMGWIAQKMGYVTFDDIPKATQDIIKLGMYGGAMIYAPVYKTFED